MEDINFAEFSFTKRPIPLPPDYRPIYKIALVVMILKLCSRGETSSLIKLHLFSWALSSPRNMEGLNAYLSNNFQNDLAVWGIEPALNRSLHYAIAEKICELVNGKYKLTDKGNKFFKMIDKDPDLFKFEKDFLNSIGKSKVTDQTIENIAHNWSLFYAGNQSN